MKLGSGKQNAVIGMGKRNITCGLGHWEGVLEIFGASGVISGCLDLNFANHFTSVKGKYCINIAAHRQRRVGGNKNARIANLLSMLHT